MKLHFEGDIEELLEGIKIFEKEFGFCTSDDGVHVQVEKNSSRKIEVICNGDSGVIKYYEKIHFFRALGLFIEALRESDKFEIHEEPQFTMNGVMIDVAQSNAVPNSKTVKNLITKMAAMGLNMFMLYTEDNYEIDGEPYFGYMQGRYTADELREYDDYAYIFGIEMIPCIQTLAHLTSMLKWNVYNDIKDDNTTLLVGYEKTYEFIEKMIKAAIAPFRTKRIHIGMDEAINLGLGQYLNKNGYRPKFDIMTEHLNRVLEITKKYGLKPMIWSDMYFRAGSKTGEYYDMESVIPQNVINQTPKDVQLVYWDYYHNDEDFYIEWIERHRRFGSDPIFAGGIWNWKGFCTNYCQTFSSTNAALNVCKKYGVKEVIATTWGGVGSENYIYSTILGFQLYAEHGYSRELDMEKLKKRFKFCTGANFDDYMDIQYLDEIPGVEVKDIECYNPSVYIVWQDVLMGLFDRNLEDFNLSRHYSDLRKRMEAHISNNGEFGFVFEFMEKLCAVLEAKAEIGIDIHNAYKAKDISTLQYMVENRLPDIWDKVNQLRVINRKLWFETYKPFGWEVLDIRYGGVLTRIDSAKERIREFVEGKISVIEELEQERLYFENKPGLVSNYIYGRMVTAGRFTV